MKDLLKAVPFDYTLCVNGEETEVHAAVIIIPNGLRYPSGTMDATVYAEDELGKVVNFSSVAEAQAWIDKYGEIAKFRIEHGDELHVIICEEG